MNLEKYAELTDDIELKLDEADKAAVLDNTRYTPDETFTRIRERISGGIKYKVRLLPLFEWDLTEITILPHTYEKLYNLLCCN